MRDGGPGGRGLTYAELVSIRDASGAIVSLTTDMAAMNLLRAELVERVLDALEGVGVLQLRIPLGSLLDLDVLWGLGPSLKVQRPHGGGDSRRPVFQQLPKQGSTRPSTASNWSSPYP